MNTETLKAVQNKSVEILNDFDTFCRENQIDYGVAFGTALGAKRHSGFIPWDDDIDVQIKYEDLKKLIVAWDKNGNKEKYFLQTKKNDPNLPNFWPRLRMNGTTSLGEGGENIPLHWGLPLDIFILVHVPNGKIKRKLFYLFMAKTNRLCKYAYEHYQTNKIRCKISNGVSLILFSVIGIINSFCKRSNDVLVLHQAGRRILYLPKRISEFDSEIQFENLKLKCCKNIDEYLTLVYGDYMTLPPIENRKTHATSIIDLSNDYSRYVNFFCMRKKQ